MKQITKILIANRGEITCRIIETARKMGIATVAIYSEADSQAMHVSMADEAYCVGPAPSAQSYLVIDKVIQAAIDAGADAIHPGYGFLSENLEFAQACADNDIIFIGPDAHAISAMGLKSEAKRLMEKAKVPLLPGYLGDQDPKKLKQEADKIGYPLLIKASAGGGGKGMRIVDHESEFEDALASAKHEAKNSFNNDEVLLEKFLTQPRHVEIQVFADQHGNAFYLHDRDCSIQRRYQKIIEEAPAPNISADVKKAMGEAAVQAAQAIGYYGAGTIEFLFEAPNHFYFMEMNTRLQVEHPVTEKITGLDLVEWQIRVAQGQALPWKQADIPCLGHAMEARIYAEDCTQDFMPSSGPLLRWQPPETHDNLRIDTGVKQGDVVSPMYDPMLAKLIVHAQDRETACRQLVQALANWQILGISHNLNFLQDVASHPAFIAEDISTAFLTKHNVVANAAKFTCEDYAAIALAYYLQSAKTVPYSLRHFSSAHTGGYLLRFSQFEATIFALEKEAFSVAIDGHSYHFILENQQAKSDDITLLAADNKQRLNISLHPLLHKCLGYLGSKPFELSLVDNDPQNSINENDVIAPMTGKITALLCKPGQRVEEGETLVLLEAMKMEHRLKAPYSGIVEACHCSLDAMVDEGKQLVSIAPCTDKKATA